MSLPFHLVDSLDDIAPGGRVEVTGEEAHHAVAVRRLRTGERVALTDGRGAVATGTVAETGKRRFAVTVEGLEHHPRPAPRLSVVQALPKGDRGELAVEVLTEVGADRIVPWAAARCVAVWRGERAAKSHAKWRASAREAAKQARRAWHPDVPALHSTDDVTRLVAAADLAVVLHEGATAGLGALDLSDGPHGPHGPHGPYGEILLVVGPEGGLTDDEIAALEAAGAQTRRLGAEVLRTSTAGVVAAGALLARTARWA